ncbi:uncharacterized protein LTR77_004223 [Saxophila tyrrhenica]|uniref:NADP-dependent oxidoreductase domain-containing protein n=1 Tax=Saxophila tyrrhenica TaxID=1690608 RepID=A0AAV9PC21_9PEZI|nr:hypothetical protein LTR77_004223 [Saxophila tyrrhenica]
MTLPKSFPLKSSSNLLLQLPSVGFGTWASGETSWAKDSVLTALRAGYRHLDCAWMYGVDQPVSQAIKESGIPREEIFITSKFWPHFGSPENVELCLDKVLDNMGLEYLDLYLAHWPVVWKPASRQALEKARSGPDTTREDKGQLYDGDKPVMDWEHCTKNIASKRGHEGSFVPTWKAMQECVRKGKAKAVGVSNFSITEIEELLPHEGDVPVACNQVECHPWLPQREMVEFAKKHGIAISCYSPFAGQKADGATLLKDEKVVKLAEKNGMDVGQFLHSWAVQRGTVPLGKSATPQRITSNLDVRRLSDEDMRALDGLEIEDGKGRTIDFTEAWGVPLYTD